MTDSEIEQSWWQQVETAETKAKEAENEANALAAQREKCLKKIRQAKRSKRVIEIVVLAVFGISVIAVGFFIAPVPWESSETLQGEAISTVWEHVSMLASRLLVGIVAGTLIACMLAICVWEIYRHAQDEISAMSEEYEKLKPRAVRQRIEAQELRDAAKLLRQHAERCEAMEDEAKLLVEAESEQGSC